MKYFVKFLMVLALIAGCEGEETTLRDSGSAYFPLNKGIYQVYSITETLYSGSNTPERSTYELMTEVVDSIVSAGGYLYVINRSRRQSETAPWEPLDTWSGRKNSREAIVSEGNTPFLKVIFPVREGTRWDGNTFNTLGEDEYELKNAAEPYVVGGMNFEHTLTIEQERNEDFVVFNDTRREVYALDVGLVYRETIQYDYCTDDNCLGQQKIVSGIEVKQAIKQYGKY